MYKVEIMQAIADAVEDCDMYSTAYLISDVASIYAGDTLLNKYAVAKLAELLINNQYELKDAVQICFGNFVVKRTPVEEFNFFYNKYSESTVQFEHDFLNGMLAVAKWFDLPVKGREDE
ncbi:hypothetical protein [Lysinibacillus piscis]|uniref:Uncharacterized protein n=1 Tax=Lysinibacillus piscis TaxID=2518931 RepID=A0ABQ5NM32_9BACI|nr:hypothetical protein [Lysinibacillus sp. KH24]GLC89372.1 hypothetical protein LYSBPC_24990 [Lysinibacillus sp. KH24]